MDISKIDIVGASNNGVEVDILNPVNNEPIGLKIRVVGAMSTNYKDDMVLMFAELEDLKAKFELPETATKKQKAEANIKAEKLDEELTAKFLAKYTIGWEGMVEHGKKIKFSEEEAERIYRQYPLIRGQVQKGMTTVANFLQA